MTFPRTSIAVFFSVALAGGAAMSAPASATLSTAVTVGVAGALNPCALVTAPEASKAMGVSSLPGKFHAGKRGSSCRYYSPDHTKNVFVQNSEAGDMMGAAQLGGKPILGIGDKAIWAMGSLFVEKNGKVVQVGLYLSAASMKTMDAAVLSLGKTVASRM